MKTITCVILLFVFISCNQRKYLVEYKNVDIKKVNLLLDSINNSIEDEVMKYSDSIIKSLDLTHLPIKVTGTLYIPNPEKIDCLDTTFFFNMIKKIENKDIAEYLYCFERRPCSDRLDYTPYALYMATVTNNAEVSLSVYKSLSSINRSKRENIEFIDDDMSLDKLDNKQRNLALYFLIESHKQENVIASDILSYYFEKGLYFFPKNLAIAYKLKSIYLIDNDIHYWPGTNIRIE